MDSGIVAVSINAVLPLKDDGGIAFAGQARKFTAVEAARIHVPERHRGAGGNGDLRRNDERSRQYRAVGHHRVFRKVAEIAREYLAGIADNHCVQTVVNGNVSAVAILAMSDGHGVGAAAFCDNPGNAGANLDAAAIAVLGAADAGRVVTASRHYAAAFDYNVAAGNTIPGSYACTVAAVRIQLPVPLDGQRLPDGDMDAGIIDGSLDHIAALEDDRRVAKAV